MCTVHGLGLRFGDNKNQDESRRIHVTVTVDTRRVDNRRVTILSPSPRRQYGTRFGDKKSRRIPAIKNPGGSTQNPLVGGDDLVQGVVPHVLLTGTLM